MSTTSREFTAVRPEGRVRVEAGRWNEEGDEFFIGTTDDHAYLSNEDAPAFALAVLEAAGYTGGEDAKHVLIARAYLKDHVEEQARRKAESEGAAKLDEEAEALYEAYRRADLSNLNEWDRLAESYRKPWREAAKKARELHGAAK
jgi:hypothetical protein